MRNIFANLVKLSRILFVSYKSVLFLLPFYILSVVLYKHTNPLELKILSFSFSLQALLHWLLIASFLTRIMYIGHRQNSACSLTGSMDYFLPIPRLQFYLLLCFLTSLIGFAYLVPLLYVMIPNKAVVEEISYRVLKIPSYSQPEWVSLSGLFLVLYIVTFLFLQSKDFFAKTLARSPRPWVNVFAYFSLPFAVLFGFLAAFTSFNIGYWTVGNFREVLAFPTISKAFIVFSFLAAFLYGLDCLRRVHTKQSSRNYHLQNAVHLGLFVLFLSLSFSKELRVYVGRQNFFSTSPSPFLMKSWDCQVNAATDFSILKNNIDDAMGATALAGMCVQTKEISSKDGKEIWKKIEVAIQESDSIEVSRLKWFIKSAVNSENIETYSAFAKVEANIYPDQRSPSLTNLYIELRCDRFDRMSRMFKEVLRENFKNDLTKVAETKGCKELAQELKYSREIASLKD